MTKAATNQHAISEEAEPRSRCREDYPVLRDLPTRWSDQDTYGHVNNAVHYVLIDSAVNGWLIEASGADVRQLSALGVLVESSCRYFKEIHFPETVTAGVRLETLGRSSVQYDVALFTRGDAPAATARFVHVYIDRHSRRPVPVPEEIRRALLQLQ